MKVLRTIAQRLALGLATAWAVLTIVFLAFTVTKDWVANRIAGQIIWAMTGPDAEDREVIEEEVERALAEYAASRGLDRPLHEQYLDWMGNMVRFQWGESFRTGEPVVPLVTDAVTRTAMYALPAIVLAVAIGLLIGLYAAMNPSSPLADTGRVGSYVLFALPSFWLGGLLISWGHDGPRDSLLFEHVFPIALVTMTLLGGYVSFSRANALEYTSAEFVTLARAKGAGPLGVAQHVVRNAAIPLFSMLFTEALGLLVLSIFVIEVVFGIDGFGLMFFFAMEGRDIPVLLGATMVIVFVGILANVVQDLSYQYLDPRIEATGRSP